MEGGCANLVDTKIIQLSGGGVGEGLHTTFASKYLQVLTGIFAQPYDQVLDVDDKTEQNLKFMCMNTISLSNSLFCVCVLS